MKRLFSVPLLLILLSIAIHTTAQTCGVKCGVERWQVKTLTDTTVDNIDSDEVSKTIKWFRTRTRPSTLPNTKRLIGIETMTFRVRGEVVAFKREDDKDFHVVIANPNNHKQTIVIEFPDPECKNVCSSDFLDRIRQARQDFIAKFGQPTASFKEPEETVVIEIVGIGFFDRLHGQRGMAPSGIEIHPVLSFRVVE
jgi:hypothetical protein